MAHDSGTVGAVLRTPASRPPRPDKAQSGCGHEETEHVGSGGRVTYLRCLACGAVIVAQGDRVWSVGPLPA